MPGFDFSHYLACLTLLSGSCALTHVQTLCDPVDCSPPGSSAHGILQAGILEWAAISFFWGSSQPRDRPQLSSFSCIGRRILYH